MKIPPGLLIAAFWTPALLWAALIFALSANPSPPQPPGAAALPLADKAEHFAAYGIFAAFVLFALRKTHRNPGWGAAVFDPFIAAVAASAYGATDELHQLFVPPRTADALDWLVDSIGGAFVALALAPHVAPRAEPIEAPARAVETAEGRVALIDTGEGPAVLHIHGWRGSKRFFEDAPRLLPGRRHIMIDLLGFGDSEKPVRFGYRPQDHARVVWDVAQKLGVKEADVVGHSMGGVVALELSRDHPEFVKRLVLVEPALVLDVHSAFPLNWNDAVAAGLAISRFAKRDPDALPREFVASPGMLRKEFIADAQKAPYHAALRSLAALGTSTGPLLAQAAKVPTLLIFGDAAFPVRAEYAKALANQLAAPVIHVAKTRHCPMIEDPTTFWKAVSEFLSGQVIT